MKTRIIAFVALAIFSIPALCSAEKSRQGPYVSAFIGAAIPGDQTVSSYDYYFGRAYSDDVSFNTGVYTGATGGYDSGFVRLEGELAYRYNEIDTVTDRFNGIKFQNVNGDIGVFSTMFNIFFDIHNSSPVTPYLGGGIGFASMYLSDTTANGFLLYGEGYDTVFAYQFGAGVDIALNRNMSLDLGYRYFMTDTANFESDYYYNFNPVTASFKYESHNVAVGFKYKF
jgi:opacity protein-like surface antigen